MSPKIQPAKSTEKCKPNNSVHFRPSPWDHIGDFGVSTPQIGQQNSRQNTTRRKNIAATIKHFFLDHVFESGHFLFFGKILKGRMSGPPKHLRKRRDVSPKIHRAKSRKKCQPNNFTHFKPSPWAHFSEISQNPKGKDVGPAKKPLKT